MYRSFIFPTPLYPTRFPLRSPSSPARPADTFATSLLSSTLLLLSPSSCISQHASQSSQPTSPRLAWLSCFPFPFTSPLPSCISPSTTRIERLQDKRYLKPFVTEVEAENAERKKWDAATRA